ncbi:syntenin-1-like [Artemia franciscana]|uniref:PDZ domain-containing protein n=1 Tax=Artemia franciscana TaxID=6661 RepID=A0AA88I951_ARTSF|nr:hypothetical protein QYM36_002674 [Artemia franciscana]KAK2722196.1 hypothetical protein QYM36_002674 [Artemia franciscana]
MPIYPSLEDMQADRLVKAQMQAYESIKSSFQQNTQQSSYPSLPFFPFDNGHNNPPPPAPTNSLDAKLYPSLQEFMGLELTPALIAANMPEYLDSPESPDYSRSIIPAQQVAMASSYRSNVYVNSHSNVVAPLSSATPGLSRAQVNHGVREVLLCKDFAGKIGLRVQPISKGIFVSFVQTGSPAAMGGLRFGDQVLQINGENVAGYSMEKVHEILKKTETNSIHLAVRDRPFERTITLHKDSVGHIGFQFKDGTVSSLVKDSSAARNGLLTDHRMLEINGQNVVGLKDKEITKMIEAAGNVVTLTIMPKFLYEHMMRHMSTSLVKKLMDHSVPDL